MCSLSDSSLNEEISLNDSIDFIKNSDPLPCGYLKPNLERNSNISQEDRTSNTLSSKYIF